MMNLSMDVMRRVVNQLLSVVVVDIVVMIISVMIRQSKNGKNLIPKKPRKTFTTETFIWIFVMMRLG